jgi:hypothetical protein
MRQSAILILCMGLAATLASCRPEKTTGEGQRGTRSSSSDQPSPNATPKPGMARVAAMDFSLPPGEHGSGGNSGGNPSLFDKKTDTPAELKAALATLDRILVRQKDVLKLWQDINTLADAQKHRKALLKGVLDVLAMTIASMQKAVSLSKGGLAKFLKKQGARRVHTRKMNDIIKARQHHLTSLPGGKAFFEALKKSATVEVRKHSQALTVLGRQLLKRKEELKR